MKRNGLVKVAVSACMAAAIVTLSAAPVVAAQPAKSVVSTEASQKSFTAKRSKSKKFKFKVGDVVVCNFKGNKHYIGVIQDSFYTSKGIKAHHVQFNGWNHVVYEKYMHRIDG